MSSTNGKQSMSDLPRERAGRVAEFMLRMITQRDAQELAEQMLASCVLYAAKHREEFLADVQEAQPKGDEPMCDHEVQVFGTVLDTLAVSFS